MQDFPDPDGRHPGIADKELMGPIAGIAAGHSARPGLVLFVGVDNTHAVCWVVKGKARSAFSRKLLSTLLLRGVMNGVGIIVFYLRTHRNLTADEITRIQGHDLPAWGSEKGIIRGEMPEIWKNSKTFVPHLEWDRPREQRAPLELTDEIISTFATGRVVERNASDYTVTWLLEGLVVRVHPMDPRFSPVVGEFQNWPRGSTLAKRPLMMMGEAHSGHELRSFHTLLGEIQPPIAVLVTPSEVVLASISSPLWAQHLWIDSSAICGVLGGSWNVFVRTRRPLKLSVSSTESTCGTTIAPRYEQMGRVAENDPPGRQVWYSPPIL